MQTSGVPISFSLRMRSVASAQGTWSVVLILLLIQLIISLAGGHDGLPGLYQTLGVTRASVLSGEVWRLVTYGLLHGGWAHLTLNALCLLMLGARIEGILGPVAVWKTIVAGTVTGGIFHVLAVPGGEDVGILVGISGGCMGLLILLTTLSPDSRMWPLPVSARSLGAGVMTAELLLALMDPRLALPGFSTAGQMLVKYGLGGWFDVGHACHFGGGLAGFLMGRWLLRPRITADRLRREREQREAKRRV